jgi:basic membrane protein A and related proteins
MNRGTLVAAALLVAAFLFPASASPAAKRQLRVGFVTLSGVVPTKRTLEGQIFSGFVQSEKQLGVTGRVIYVSPTQDASGALSYLARQRYDLIIVALPRIEVVYSVARKFPRARFFLVDLVGEPPHKPKNVQASVYRAGEAGYLAGYLAASLEHRRRGKHVISAVGGFRFVGVDRWIVGYVAGARKADPAIVVRVDYSFDFANPAKCRRVALRQIAKGSGVVFGVAGACGLGALQAAKEQGVWAVGVDIDQSFLGPHILTSAVIKFDAGVYAVVKRLVRGNLGAGRDIVFDLRNGGVGLGRISPRVDRALLRRLEKIRAAIAAGRIRVPRAT